jgi:toxin secretion/phage lysis holin
VEFHDQVLKGWVATGPWVFALVMAIMLDITGGMMVAYAGKGLSSSVSRLGIARKVVMLLVVAFFSIIDGFLPAIPIPHIGSVTWAGTSAFYMLITEGLSLTEKAALLNAPIPYRLVAALAKVRDELGSAPGPATSTKATEAQNETSV